MVATNHEQTETAIHIQSLRVKTLLVEQIQPPMPANKAPEPQENPKTQHDKPKHGAREPEQNYMGTKELCKMEKGATGIGVRETTLRENK